MLSDSTVRFYRHLRISAINWATSSLLSNVLQYVKLQKKCGIHAYKTTSHVFFVNRLYLNSVETCMMCCISYASLSSHSRMFHSYGDVTIAGEGLQIFTYARHSWTLSSGVFFNVPHPLRQGPTV